MAEEPEKIIVTQQNWRIIQDHIHAQCMKKMDIQQGSLTEAIFLGLASGGEMGEMQNVLKKIWRDGASIELMEQLRKEAGDVMLYMDHFFKAFEWSTIEIILETVQKNVDRPDFIPFRNGLKEALAKAVN